LIMKGFAKLLIGAFGPAKSRLLPVRRHTVKPFMAVVIPDEGAIAANVRRLRNRRDIRARMLELADHSAKMAGLDAGWALVRTRQIVDFDLAAFLKGDGDLSDFPGDIEIIEEEVSNGSDMPARKLFKLKAKAADRLAGLTLMARIAGWLAAEKVEATTEGKQIIFEVVTAVPAAKWR
jgi:hypothetical protein